MKSRLLALLSAVSFLLLLTAVALPAFAAKPQVAAKTTATLRASADDSADSVATVKKGDKVTILGTSGDWSHVKTTAGKDGWVHSSVVSEKKASFDSMSSDPNTVAAAEGTTEMAVRGKGVKRKTVVVGTGKVPANTVKRLSDLLRQIPQLSVVDQHVETRQMPSSPAGGLDGAKQLAAARKADFVVAVAPGTGKDLRYEIVDLKKNEVLATGDTSNVGDARTAVNEVRDAVNAALTKPAAAASPADSPAMSATSSGAASQSSNDCVQKCMERSQMKAMSMDAIKADCEKSCAK